MDLISKELQNNNHHAVLEIFKLVVQQNTRLKSCCHQIHNEIRNIKGASDELSRKLDKLRQEQQNNHHSSLLQQIMDINLEINHHSNHIMSRITPYAPPHHNGTDTHSQSYSYYNESNCRESIDDTEHTIHSTSATHTNGVNDHDLSRIIHNIENSENKTDYCEESSIKTESQSITFVTDEHHAGSHTISTSNFSDDTMHHLHHLNNGSNFKRKSTERQKQKRKHKNKHRQKRKRHKTKSSRGDTATRNEEHSNSKSVLSQHGSPEEIVSKLESDGRILALIEKSETKRTVSKRQMVKFLQKKGVDLDKINAAYHEYYQQHNLYEIVFENHRHKSTSQLGFGVTADEKGNNAMITWMEDHELMRKGMKTGSVMYEINGKRVIHKPHNEIMNIWKEQRQKGASFYIIFEYNEAKAQGRKTAIAEKKRVRARALPLHEHSMITSITRSHEDIEDVVSRVDINWEQIGQILLDHRFLGTARLINQALDHLETFCTDEDVDENNWRDEICKAWSIPDDRGILLWQILYGNLKYSENERRWFYDLMLHFYFKLNDMKTVNIAFLCTKILRAMKENTVANVDLVQMKEILAVNKVDGFSFNAEIKTAKCFADLFQTMRNVSSSVWHKVYYELTQWNPDETIRNKHENHQKKYKNKVITKDDAIAGRTHQPDITIFNDITRVSIRNDIDYSNSAEKKQWMRYRHNIKNVFIAFAGYRASQMTKKELNLLLKIFDIEQFWSTPLRQQDVITMDEFIKYLCSEYINDNARDIKQHIEKLSQWTLFVNALHFLDEMEDELHQMNGILQYHEFQRFAINLSLNELETEILFNKLKDVNTNRNAQIHASGSDNSIHVNHIFEWLKQKLYQKHCMTRAQNTTVTKQNDSNSNNNSNKRSQKQSKSKAPI